MVRCLIRWGGGRQLTQALARDAGITLTSLEGRNIYWSLSVRKEPWNEGCGLLAEEEVVDAEIR